MKFIFFKILRFFDYLHQKKINKFLANQFKNIDTFFDIGAHRGETIGIYLKHFKIKKIYSFEPIIDNFKYLELNKKKFSKKYSNTLIYLENFALGSKSISKNIKFFDESSSSTINNINFTSKYFKKKNKYLMSKKKEDLFVEKKIKIIRLKDYLETKKIDKIDFMKIDTEGYEFEVLLGAEEYIKKIKMLIFEHHYHNMLIKNYTFSDIHNLLKKYNFHQINKFKMPFRKTFEYIYINNIR